MFSYLLGINVFLSYKFLPTFWRSNWKDCLKIYESSLVNKLLYYIFKKIKIYLIVHLVLWRIHWNKTEKENLRITSWCYAVQPTLLLLWEWNTINHNIRKQLFIHKMVMNTDKKITSLHLCLGNTPKIVILNPIYFKERKRKICIVWHLLT